MCGTAIALASTALGVFGAAKQYKAGKEAEDAADERARAIELSRASELADMQEAQAAKESRTRAMIAASGTAGTGTQSGYLREMQKQGQQRSSWLSQVSASEQKAAKTAGSQASSQATAGALGSLSQIPSFWR